MKKEEKERWRKMTNLTEKEEQKHGYKKMNQKSNYVTEKNQELEKIKDLEKIRKEER